MDTNSTLSKIEAEISQDPSNSIWIKYMAYPMIGFGILATLTSGYICYIFLIGINYSLFWASIMVIAFEGTKFAVIVFYEYVKKHSFLKFSSTLKTVLWSSRLLLIMMSITCCMMKMSENLDNPNYNAMLNAKENQIYSEY